MSKFRIAALRDIIKTGAIGDQQELLESLLKRGIEATQSSVSRDLKRIGAVKIDGAYQIPAVTVGVTDADFVSAKVSSGELVVVKTGPGGASRMGYFIDKAKLPGITGTIAGEDTVFVAIDKAAKAAKIISQIQQLLV
ncbi:MAG: arginine repressor [Oligoflexales bacterium]